MKRVFLFTFLLSAAGFSSLSADDAVKGQKVYMQKCKSCHGNGAKGAVMMTQEQWIDLFADNGEMIIEKHEGTGAKKFFNSPKFQKYAPYLKAFLHKYASDSGNVPSC